MRISHEQNMERGSNLAYTMLRGRKTPKKVFDSSRDMWARPWAKRLFKTIHEKMT